MTALRVHPGIGGFFRSLAGRLDLVGLFIVPAIWSAFGVMALGPAEAPPKGADIVWVVTMFVGLWTPFVLSLWRRTVGGVAAVLAGLAAAWFFHHPAPFVAMAAPFVVFGLFGILASRRSPTGSSR